MRLFRSTASMYRPRTVKRPPAAAGSPGSAPSAGTSAIEEGVFKPRTIKRKGVASPAALSPRPALVVPSQSNAAKAEAEEERTTLELLFSTLQICFSDYALSVHRSGGLLDQLKHNDGGCTSNPFDSHRLLN